MLEKQPCRLTLREQEMTTLKRATTKSGIDINDCDGRVPASPAIDFRPFLPL
jgi:hypothetical protein